MSRGPPVPPLRPESDRRARGLAALAHVPGRPPKRRSPAPTHSMRIGHPKAEWGEWGEGGEGGIFDRAVLKREKKTVPVHGFFKNDRVWLICSTRVGGDCWLAAGGDCRLAVGGWWLAAVGSWWQLAAVGSW